jgi:hypothetical protein
MPVVFKKYYSHTALPATAANATTVIGPIDVSAFDKFNIQFFNHHATIGLAECIVEVAYDSSGTAAGVPPNWVQINTSTLPQPSALGATATTLTTSGVVDNCYKWLRVRAAGTATAIVGSLAVTIGGFERFTK